MLTANIYRNAAAIAFRLGGRITIGTAYRPQNVYLNGVPVRSGTATPLVALGQNQIGQYCIGPSLARWGPRKLQGQDQCPVHCVSADNFFAVPSKMWIGGGDSLYSRISIFNPWILCIYSGFRGLAEHSLHRSWGCWNAENLLHQWAQLLEATVVPECRPEGSWLVHRTRLWSEHRQLVNVGGNDGCRRLHAAVDWTLVLALKFTRPSPLYQGRGQGQKIVSSRRLEANDLSSRTHHWKNLDLMADFNTI